MKKKDQLSFGPNRHSIEYLNLLGYALDQLDTMAGITDLEGKIIFANQSALKHVGATMEKVRGVPFKDSPWRSQSDKAKKVSGLLMEKARKGETSLVEDSIIGADGSEIPVLFSISPIFDNQDNIVGFLPEGKVISDIKNLEGKIKKEKKEIQQWIDSMSAYIAKSDPNGKILSCNKAFMRAFNTCFEEDQGSYICDLAQIENTGDQTNLLKNAIMGAKGGRKSSLEVMLKLNNGSQPAGYFLFNASPIKDPNGRISFLALEITDISDQVQLREQVLDREKRYALRLEQEVAIIKRHLVKTEQFSRNLVESVPIGVLYLDHSKRVVYANPTMKHQFHTSGISKGEITGKTIEELGLRSANNFWKIDKAQDQDEQIYGQRKMVLLKEKEAHFCFEVRSGPLVTPDRTIEGSVLTINDVTKRVSLESELLTTRIQAEKMSSMGLLISGVAHELNNPLTSIIGCAEYLATKENLDSGVGEAAQIIMKDAIRASRIVKDLLAASYKNHMEERIVNVNEAIDEMIGIRFHELKHSGVRPVLRLSRDINPVLADPTQIQQVVDNLIRNAVDAIVESGVGDRIVIRTRMQDNWIVITFEDNGPGVVKENLHKIFDPFFTTKKVGKGTGLGLSVVYGIIQRHGGTVSYDERFNSGARFVIRLPVTPESSSFEEPASVDLLWKPTSLLLADGERNLRYSLSKYLTRLGCHVQTASNGRAALDLVLKNDYEMLLVATNLPIMSGFSLYEQIKARRPGQIDRLVFMYDSPSDSADSAYFTYNLQMLRKPFGKNDIFNLFNRFHKKISKRN
ncbi:PAS domain S-box protein [Desulfosarcina alkanivorans]|uniref:PAS domain S-box protein n=1 Tax=Desulfosarcina alkanivorans TaxID=571177 RepID=UPI0012D35FEC|nr:PAS domain S-box protein [Desulfosarcina alkanivorans]